jgi:hypothetical protein
MGRTHDWTDAGLENKKRMMTRIVNNTREVEDINTPVVFTCTTCPYPVVKKCWHAFSAVNVDGTCQLEKANNDGCES